MSRQQRVCMGEGLFVPVTKGGRAGGSLSPVSDLDCLPAFPRLAGSLGVPTCCTPCPYRAQWSAPPPPTPRPGDSSAEPGGASVTAQEQQREITGSRLCASLLRALPARIHPENRCASGRQHTSAGCTRACAVMLRSARVAAPTCRASRRSRSATRCRSSREYLGAVGCGHAAMRVRCRVVRKRPGWPAKERRC